MEWDNSKWIETRTADKAWHDAHPGYNREKRARNKNLKVIPLWINQANVDAIYKKAQLLNLVVDHIVPLAAPTVCGLHWEGNLQIITAKENLIKGHWVWPDMWN